MGRRVPLSLERLRVPPHIHLTDLLLGFDNTDISTSDTVTLTTGDRDYWVFMSRDWFQLFSPVLGQQSAGWPSRQTPEALGGELCMHYEARNQSGAGCGPCMTLGWVSKTGRST